MLATNWLDYCS